MIGWFRQGLPDKGTKVVYRMTYLTNEVYSFLEKICRHCGINTDTLVRTKLLILEPPRPRRTLEKNRQMMMATTSLLPRELFHWLHMWQTFIWKWTWPTTTHALSCVAYFLHSILWLQCHVWKVLLLIKFFEDECVIISLLDYWIFKPDRDILFFYLFKISFIGIRITVARGLNTN